MKTNIPRILGLCITLCLGLTWACVKVDVSVKSSATPFMPFPPLPEIKPPISIEDLKKRHVVNKRGRVCSPSHSLPINRDKQQTAAWCWAASSRTILNFHENDGLAEGTAIQCDIVKNIFGSRLNGSNCCEPKISPDFINAPPTCVRGGWPHWVFTHYQFNYEWVDGLLDDWEALKNELCEGPLISVIEWSGGGKHTFVIHGYQEPMTNQESSTNALLERAIKIYDPIENDPQDLTFDEFIKGSVKKQGRSYEFSHELTYVQISPMSKEQP